jgi:uncharacterized protein YndB with AHSA1/START domain
MEEIHVSAYIHASVERVFDAVSDHESFLRTGDGLRTTITRPGTSERNGLGCLREVRNGRLIRFVEEVTGWERPASFEYQIRESTLPIRHHGGRLRFTARGAGTEIEWTSRFEVPVPLLGRALGPVARQTLTTAFTDLLLAAKLRLEAA